MRRLVSEAPTDDVILHDGTNVIETTTGTLLVWETNRTGVCRLPSSSRSISAQRIAKFAKSQSLIRDSPTGDHPTDRHRGVPGMVCQYVARDLSGHHHR